jgi:hypothetical protein
MRFSTGLWVNVAACLLLLGAGSAHAGNSIAVCIGPDGSLRLLGNAVACKAGEKTKLFAEWEPEKPELPDAKDEEEQAGLRKQIDALSKRLAALEQPHDEDGVRRVTAPFEVVGRGGTVILRVAEKVSSDSGNGARVTIGAGDAGNYGLRVHQNGGPVVAGIGQSRIGTGVVVVLDGDGVAATMNANDRRVEVYSSGDKPAAALLGMDNAVAVFGADGKAVTVMRRSQSGSGGTLEATDGSGTWVFRGGFDGTDGNACARRPGAKSRCLSNLPLAH